MFSGKLYFNYIYGIGLLGCIAIYCLLNLMSGRKYFSKIVISILLIIIITSRPSVAGVSLTCVVSVLGYCLLPIVALSGVSVLFSLSGFVGNILTGAAVAWCALSSSKLFVTALEMKQQQVSSDPPTSLEPPSITIYNFSCWWPTPALCSTGFSPSSRCSRRQRRAILCDSLAQSAVNLKH